MTTQDASERRVETAVHGRLFRECISEISNCTAAVWQPGDQSDMYTQNIYTLHSLSRMLQVSTRTLRREMEEGKLTFVRIRGRVRFRQVDVHAYLVGCTAGMEANDRDVESAMRAAVGSAG